MAERRFYWLKLKDDFFKNKAIKKLRKIAGGDTYTIIYLKMLLTGIKNDGLIIYEGIEPTLEEEVALDIDEDIDNVKVTIAFLKSNNLLLETDKANEYAMPESISNIGSEGASAERVRNFRSKQKTLQCNEGVTQVKRISNVEKEIEKREEKEIEKDNSITSNTLSSSSEDNYDKECKSVFDFWNDAKIIVHKSYTPKLEKLIKEKISFYGISKVREAILNYARVYFDKNYFFSYKWKLEDFLKQNNAMPSFFNEGEKWLNYIGVGYAQVVETSVDDNGGFTEL